MNAERLLKQLRKLSLENREAHANSLITDNTTGIEDVRYSQGYVNALDWVLLTTEGLAKEEQEEIEDNE